MTLKTVNNSDPGTADTVGGNDWDQLTEGVNLGEAYKYLVVKSGSTYYVKGSSGEVVHSGTTPATEIQWALDNMTVGRTHKEVLAIRGNITLTGLTIPSYTVLDLIGAYIKQANATNTNFLINNDTSGGNTQIEIFGGTIDGNKANQSLDATPYNTRDTINLTKCTDSSVHDSYIVNSNSSGVYLQDCTNVAVVSNTIVTPRKLGVYHFCSSAGAGKYTWMNHNYISGPSENFLAAFGASDVMINGNYCDTCTTSGINCNGSRMNIRNNFVKDATLSGIALSIEGTYSSDYSYVSDNTVWEAKSTGISCNAAIGSNVLTVSNNVVKGATSGQSTGAYGLRVGRGITTVASGNRCTGWQQAGMLVEGNTTIPLTKCIVANNICWNNGLNTGGASKLRSGILLSGNIGFNTGLNVYGNICYDSAGAGGTQLYGIYFEATTDAYIHDNDLRGNVTTGLLDAGDNV